MTLSGDGGYLFVTGYDNNPLPAATALPLPSATPNVNVPRAVARIKFDGTIETEAFVAGPAGSGGVETGGNFNGVYSLDGNQLYVSGFNGVSYFALFAPSASLVPATATITSTSFTVLGLEGAGGNLYAVGGPTTGASNLIQSYGGLPVAPASLSALPGINSTTDPNQTFTVDAYLTHENGTGAPDGINTLYLSDDGPSFSHGRITKWTLGADGNWSLTDAVIAGTGNSAITFYWLAGHTDGSGNVTLAATYGNGGNSDTGPGFLYAITDTNGYGMPIGTGGTHSDAVTTVASVGSTSNESFRGVALAPQGDVATHINIIVPDTVTAGMPFSITVQALDAGNNVVSGYTGTVHFVASNGAMASYTFTAADMGQHTFSGLELRQAGTVTVTGTDTVTGITGMATLTIVAASPDHIGFTAPDTFTAGVPFQLTVTIQDQFGNTVTDYTGTVHFQLTGPVMASVDFTFPPADMGSHTFGGLVLNQPGDYTLTATDSADSTLTGTLMFTVST
jgi:hypothetical protein